MQKSAEEGGGGGDLEGTPLIPHLRRNFWNTKTIFRQNFWKFFFECKIVKIQGEIISQKNYKILKHIVHLPKIGEGDTFSELG